MINEDIILQADKCSPKVGVLGSFFTFISQKNKIKLEDQDKTCLLKLKNIRLMVFVGAEPCSWGFPLRFCTDLIQLLFQKKKKKFVFRTN